MTRASRPMVKWERRGGVARLEACFAVLLISMPRVTGQPLRIPNHPALRLRHISTHPTVPPRDWKLVRVSTTSLAREIPVLALLPPAQQIRNARWRSSHSSSKMAALSLRPCIKFHVLNNGIKRHLSLQLSQLCARKHRPPHQMGIVRTARATLRLCYKALELGV